MGGGLGEGWCQIAPDRRVADDGKRFQAMDVVLALLLGENLLEMGGDPGRGGQKIRPEGRDADFWRSKTELPCR